MEQTLNQVKVTSKTLVREIAIAITFAIAYFILVKINPFTALAGTASLATFATIRLANVLYAFILVTPSAAVGIAMGGYAFNVSSGKVAFGSYPIIPFIMMVVGLGVYYVINKIGRSVKTDLIILTIYGAIIGSIVALNNILFAVATDETVLGTLFTIGALYKIFNHIIMFLLGYVFVTKFDSIRHTKNISSK